MLSVSLFPIVEDVCLLCVSGNNKRVDVLVNVHMFPISQEQDERKISELLKIKYTMKCENEYI